MSSEVPVRTRSSKRRTAQRISERSTGKKPKEAIIAPDKFTQFIDYFAQTMPQNERQNFQRGAVYAKRLIGNFAQEGFEISNESISQFISETMHGAHQHAAQRQHTYSFLDTIENEKGMEVLQLTVPFRSTINPDLAGHFSTFDNSYTKLGAFTALTISERNQANITKASTELAPNTETYLQSA